MAYVRLGKLRLEEGKKESVRKRNNSMKSQYTNEVIGRASDSKFPKCVAIIRHSRDRMHVKVEMF